MSTVGVFPIRSWQNNTGSALKNVTKAQTSCSAAIHAHPDLSLRLWQGGCPLVKHADILVNIESPVHGSRHSTKDLGSSEAQPHVTKVFSFTLRPSSQYPGHETSNLLKYSSVLHRHHYCSYKFTSMQGCWNSLSTQLLKNCPLSKIIKYLFTSSVIQEVNTAIKVTPRPKQVVYISDQIVSTSLTTTSLNFRNITYQATGVRVLLPELSLLRSTITFPPYRQSSKTRFCCYVSTLR